MSPEAANRLTAWGTCEGGRVIWARLKGAFHDLLVVNAYVPHRGRKAPPFMEDTMDQVADLVREKRKATDCVIVMGDMNGRLQRSSGDTEITQIEVAWARAEDARRQTDPQGHAEA